MNILFDGNCMAEYTVAQLLVQLYNARLYPLYQAENYNHPDIGSSKDEIESSLIINGSRGLAHTLLIFGTYNVEYILRARKLHKLEEGESGNAVIAFSYNSQEASRLGICHAESAWQFLCQYLRWDKEGAEKEEEEENKHSPPPSPLPDDGDGGGGATKGKVEGIQGYWYYSTHLYFSYLIRAAKLFSAVFLGCQTQEELLLSQRFLARLNATDLEFEKTLQGEMEEEENESGQLALVLYKMDLQQSFSRTKNEARMKVVFEVQRPPFKVLLHEAHRLLACPDTAISSSSSSSSASSSSSSSPPPPVVVDIGGGGGGVKQSDSKKVAGFDEEEEEKKE